MKTIAELIGALESGAVTGLALADDCLERIVDPTGEGGRAFLAVDPDRVRVEARTIDDARRVGRVLSPLAGIPVSIKALFDVEGMITTAGSTVLRDALPVRVDAEAVRRLRSAGLIIMGHTNMTEFAYSGLGLNPHYGTPLNPFDRERGRIPGGSSSGAAVSVTDGMAAVALGTDTGGSCRIPASFCGIVGFKPTARRVPQAGTFPLSQSLDSIGSLGRSVACCKHLDALLAGPDGDDPVPDDLSGLRFAVLQNYATDGIQPAVARAFENALIQIERTGATLLDLTLSELDRLPMLNARGGIVAAEAYRRHECLLAAKGDRYDPRVRSRIEKAKEQKPGEYEDLIEERRTMIANVTAITSGFEAVLMPTTPIQAPLFSELADDAEYGRLNLLTLRNPTIANFFDRCAISVPMRTDNGLPAGLTLMGEAMADRRLLAIASRVEALVGCPE